MKSTLRNETLAVESIPQSYKTASESHADNSSLSSVTQPRYTTPVDPPPGLSPLSLLGCAPPRDSGFTDALPERGNDQARYQDEKQNVDNGMQSLLQNMSCDENSGVHRRDDFKNSDEDDLEFEGGPMHCHEPSAIYRKDDIEDSEVGDSEFRKCPMSYEDHRMHGALMQRRYSNEPWLKARYIDPHLQIEGNYINDQWNQRWYKDALFPNGRVYTINQYGMSSNGSLAVVITSDSQRKKASGLGSTLSQYSYQKILRIFKLRSQLRCILLTKRLQSQALVTQLPFQYFHYAELSHLP